MAEEQALDRDQANVLAGRICAAAGLAARSECELLELIGEFDAAGAIRWWLDVTSLAHWLSWCCSMSPGTAREHVRVARALRRMPTVAAAFRQVGCRIQRCEKSVGWSACWTSSSCVRWG